MKHPFKRRTRPMPSAIDGAEALRQAARQLAASRVKLRQIAQQAATARMQEAHR